MITSVLEYIIYNSVDRLFSLLGNNISINDIVLNRLTITSDNSTTYKITNDLDIILTTRNILDESIKSISIFKLTPQTTITFSLKLNNSTFHGRKFKCLVCLKPVMT